MYKTLDDLISLGVLTQPTTEEMLRVKLKNLLRAYKTAVDNNKSIGESLIIAPFEDQMSDIFGSQPIIKNTFFKFVWQTSRRAANGSNLLFTKRMATKLIGIGATSSKRQEMMNKKKYWVMREKRAAEKNEILREYTANKLMKMDEGESNCCLLLFEVSVWTSSSGNDSN